MTLKEAWELYRSYLQAKNRAPRTISQYEESLRYWLNDWMDKPLVSITRTKAHERHVKLTKENGSFAANMAMKILRAIWNRSRRQYPSLPEAPTANVDFHFEGPRLLDGQAPIIPYELLPKWYQAVMQTDNPIRRDLFLFLLFTGTRSEECRSLKWKQVDLKDATVHFPVTKTKPFTLPLSDYLIEILERRRACNVTRVHFGDSEYVFPGHTETGYAAVPLLHGDELKRHPLRWTPHVLRHTYVTISENYATIPSHHARLLVNHASLKGDVHNRYNHASLGNLRQSQQAVTDALKSACGIAA
ncbi:Integrase [Mesorhizobium albiziae]|uniref:Integrase n=1 Tax=Neomesorhizobium albiziae TaxID=335020 RepID=A0A1I3VEK2_9HYPH|nr:tyrosine-type recombinase/integrase [Mesorhizobium albiziae]SFJ93570.1 Integrase [Mesorhizobium albiziae]